MTPPSVESIKSLRSPLAQTVEIHDTLSSTQERAKTLARDSESPALHGTLVLAGIQTGGRGRLGRQWGSPEGGLWMSVVLRLKLEASHATRITQTASVGVAKALWEIGVEARIKWPNDLLVDGKKICGILAESSAGRNTLSPGGMSREPDPAILGIGLNANLDPEDLKVPAREVTTIRAELGHDIDLANVLSRILNNLHTELGRLDDFAAILQDWRALNCTLGERVLVQRSGETLEGRATDLTPEGALILETTKGTVEIFEGEIERIRQSQSS